MHYFSTHVVLKVSFMHTLMKTIAVYCGHRIYSIYNTARLLAFVFTGHPFITATVG